MTYQPPKAKRGRVRGFSPWRPNAESQRLLAQIAGVLDQYADHLPVTLRQVWYRLHATCGYPKTESAYKRLGELVNRGRRAGLVDWDAIRDDGFHDGGHVGWDGVADFADTVRAWVDSYQLDRQVGQPRRVVVWCEAAGMVPQLERVCRPFSVPVLSSGGFDSVTAKHAVARRFAAWRSVLVLHVGDHDPSGVHVYGSLAADVGAFSRTLGGEVEFRRVAVLPAHVDRYGLATSPPKTTDRRAFSGETVQAEALPPDVLAETVREAVRAELDPAVWDVALGREDADRLALADWLAGLDKLAG